MFPKDHFDWLLWDSTVLHEVNQTHKDGYKIVIFTNQKGISVIFSFNFNKLIKLRQRLLMQVTLK